MMGLNIGDIGDSDGPICAASRTRGIGARRHGGDRGDPVSGWGEDHREERSGEGLGEAAVVS
jgi:hypothetical protein